MGRLSLRGLVGVLPFLVSLLVASGCRPEEAGSGVLAAPDWGPDALDVNDVSFLFPLPKTGDGIKQLRALTMDAADYLTLVPNAKDKRLHPHETGTLNPDEGGIPNPNHDMSNYKLLGVRVDPCAKDDPKKLECRIEFRLVLQPVTFEPDPFNQAAGPVVSTFDGAIHLIYVPDAELRGALVADLRALKQLAGTRTAGKALNVHPVLAEEGAGGAYWKKLLAMVDQYATPDALKVATHMNTIETDQWFFFKTERVGGKLVRKEIPFVGKDQQLFSSKGDNEISVKDKSSAPDNCNVIVDSLPGRPYAVADAGKQKAYLDAALRVDNPDLTAPGTTDCVSCHVASRAVARIKGAFFLEADDGNASRWRAPADVTATRAGLEMDNNAYSVRAFGYFGAKPSITKGTINGSAKVAALINSGN